MLIIINIINYNGMIMQKTGKMMNISDNSNKSILGRLAKL